MNKTKNRKILTFITFMDGVMCIMVLAMAGYIVERFYDVLNKGNSSMSWSLLAGMFLLMAANHALLIWRAWGEKPTEVIRQSVFSLVFLVCAGLVQFSPQNAPGTVLTLDNYTKDFCFMSVVSLYAGALIFSRVLSIVKDHTRTNVILNLLAIGAILVIMWDFEIISLVVLFVVQTVYHVATIAFTRIDMGTLKKIVRKTYAVEILSGIVLLIVAFSVLLPFIEEGIHGFGDALWYCFAIVTTIGFGDFYATTPMGRFLSVVLGLYGIIVVALITSIIVNFYNEMKDDHSQTEEEKT